MNFEQARFNMIEQQIRPWEVLDAKVLKVLAELPREDFVPETFRAQAFADMNIPLDHGQCMMQPKVEGRLLQELTLQPTDHVLEIGTGSGFVTGLLGRLAGTVQTVDLYPDFLTQARAKLAAQGLGNIEFFEGDASAGWRSDGPYDAILITGSVPSLPDAFLQQLKPGGRLVAVIGEPPIMEATVVHQVASGGSRRVSLFETSLPPLVNAETRPRFVF